MNTLTHTKAVLAGLSALTLLAITACSSSSDASVEADGAEPTTAEEQTENTASGAVYDFSAEADRQSSDELHIEVPQQLIEASETYSENRLVESITATAAESTESQCGIDLSFEYVDGTVELFEDEELWGTEVDFYVDQAVYDEAYMESEERRLAAFGHPELGRGVTNEVGKSVVETSCATSPEDGENITSVAFRSFAESEYGYQFRSLATVDLNVMASGDIAVTNASVNGYNYSGDEHGWISDSQTVDSQGNLIDN